MHPFIRGTLYFFIVLVSVGLVGCSGAASSLSEEDTVNNGYSTQDRASSTSATSKVSPSEQDKDQAIDLADLLQGSASGVQVSRTGGGVRVLIRGPNSFSASNSPLYVVDGMAISPRPNGTVPVNPRHVKSITVLKDAGATAIYGSRGANGVIVIETERR